MAKLEISSFLHICWQCNVTLILPILCDKTHNFSCMTIYNYNVDLKKQHNSWWKTTDLSSFSNCVTHVVLSCIKLYMFQIGKCNMCGCHNGRLTCTDIKGCKDDSEHQDEHKRRCEQCQEAPMKLVCGRDGRTYRSRCVAVNCSGLGENDILDGPCSNQVKSVTKIT